ncbi:GtrA family protein [Nocardia sp. NPDC003693]
MNSTAYAPGPWQSVDATSILDALGAPARTRLTGRPDAVRRFLTGDHVVAQLIRFAAVGGSSNIAYFLLFMALAEFGPMIANLAGSIVSTIIANELHRRLTFRAAGQVGWFKAQWEGGALAMIGMAISTVALAGLEFWAPGLGDFPQALALMALMAAVGGARFLILRVFVF